MIPVLHETLEKEFLSNGIGRLSDAVSCFVEEELNGSFTLEMEYPLDGINFKEIKEHKMILADTAEGSEPFEIANIAPSLKDGMARIEANHVSYRLNGMPFLRSSNTWNGAAAIMAAIKDNVPFDGASNTERIPIGFSFETDITSTAAITVPENKSVKDLLHGSEGSLLDKYGGEYEWKRFRVILHKRRGKDTNITVRYGKNLADLDYEITTEEKYNGAAPIYKSGDTYVRANHVYWRNSNIPYPYIKIEDVTQDYDSQPTTTALNNLSQTMAVNPDDKPKISISAEIVPLWVSKEYELIGDLEKLNLGDTVTVECEPLNIKARAKVVKIRYNVLRDAVDSVEIGNIRTTLADVIANGNSGNSSGSGGSSGGSGGGSTENLAPVAYSGSYNDLTEKPTIPSIAGLAKDSDLAPVAKSGSYNDLTNKPEIPSTWTKIGEATGTTPITINMANYNDVYIIVYSGRDQNDSYAFTLAKPVMAAAGTTEKSLIEGHYRSTSSYARCIVHYTASSVSLNQIYDNGANYTSTSKIVVYAR